MSAPEAPAPLLEVHGLGKRLTRDHRRSRHYAMADLAREVRLAPDHDLPLRVEEFWALKDVDLTVARGEAVGVIGPNGAGKSTLLRVLGGVTRPSRGSVVLRGSHAALLDLGAPFNPLLTGRENIEVAAAVHGIARRRFAPLVAEVAAFAELTEVIDRPMIGYSTGMQMRLGYGVASLLRPDLLLVDEVIAVGDIAFQRKCVAHIRGHLARGGSLLLVSHDLWMIQALCHRCLVLEEGRVVIDTTPNHAISTYLRASRRGQVFAPRQRGPEPQAVRDIEAEIVRCEGSEGGPLHNGLPATIEVVVRASPPASRVRWHLDVLSANRQACLARLRDPDDPLVPLGDDATTIRCHLPQLPLLPGTFYLSWHAIDEDGHEVGATAAPFPIEVVSRHSRLETLAQLPGALALTSLRTTYEPPGPSADDPTAAS